MNRIQFKRWKDFALRMADNGWPVRITHHRVHKQTVRPAVEHFFELLYHNYQYDITRIESWDNTRTDYRNAEVFEWGVRGNYEPCIDGEANRIIYEYWNPYYYSGPDRKFEAWDDLWGSRVRCCIRAGLDLVAEPSMGVIGFQKKDIERMYPDGVPGWIRSGWERKNGQWHSVSWDEIKPEGGLWL